MPDGSETLALRVVDRIAAIPAKAWNACAGGENPFTTHAFLAALEASGSVSDETGWLAQHLIAEDAGGRIVAVVPLYLKSHSYGEYVFDHGWAQAYMHAGGRYYPKLQVAVPFTPVTGHRLLVRPAIDRPAIEPALISGLEQVAKRAGVSSLHVTFCTKSEAEAFRRAGWLIRRGVQYHWHNRGYSTFDQFLAQLTHERRKAIRRERRGVAEQGIAIETLTGDAITRAHWDTFFRFYTSTSDRKWGNPYLTRDFFARLGAVMPERVVLFLARKEGAYIGGALNLRGGDTLYGRNWGCRGDHKFLHFEACYYQAIDYAIAHKLARVEAGAQGEHKIRRGYLPEMTWSAHWIANSSFRQAVADFLARETPSVVEEADDLAAHSPFRLPDGLRSQSGEHR